jgi:hypothetical protein
VAGPAGEPSASVLLVHGLGGHAYDTWRRGVGKQSSPDETFWPRWLVDDCAALAVYVTGYDAPSRACVERPCISQIRLPTFLNRLLAEPSFARSRWS